MEGSIKELSQYRFQRACEDYETAQLLLKSKNLKASVNRSYYAIFHALRAVTALDQFDSSKHSGIIAYINRNYVKEGIFDKGFSKMLDSAYRLREKADGINGSETDMKFFQSDNANIKKCIYINTGD